MYLFLPYSIGDFIVVTHHCSYPFAASRLLASHLLHLVAVVVFEQQQRLVAGCNSITCSVSLLHLSFEGIVPDQLLWDILKLEVKSTDVTGFSKRKCNGFYKYIF